MKRKLFCLICLLVLSITSQAQNAISTQIYLKVKYFDPTGTTNPDPKSPVDPPTVYQEDYTLSFASVHPAYTLYIKDEYDNVVYSTMVGDTDTTVVLPSTLSGTYEIDLVTDDYYFWGYIAL